LKPRLICLLFLSTISFLSSAENTLSGQTHTLRAPSVSGPGQFVNPGSTLPLDGRRFSRTLVEKGRLTRASIDSIQLLQYQDLSGKKKIIVEFTDEPMFLARMKSSGVYKPVSSNSYLLQFSQFTTDANAFLRSYHSTLRDQVTIGHQYYRVFFGVSATVPAWMLPLIHHLPYVKAVHFDKEIQATLEPAIELIGANTVWATFGTQGEGIRVGIIDSGIDYLHPALGGGFGPGFKVAGGRDVVNNDDDPMDDYGHGTHVAGIVAADADSFKGVAPKAVLYAYKALDATGRGLSSDVIEAIERTVDPDQNGDDADKLDVVNVSLGSDEGSPTDPSSIAVNNAVKLGVVFCVAAGNSGARTPVQGKENNYFFDGSATISSPGTAELAITVGASDLSDMLAHFSSRGPNRMSFSIKPEVLAPGVDINSTYLASGFKVMSGTSMATPMVTGVVALTKSVHPAWSPAMIKSAIVNTAKNIGLSAYLQGGGRVQAVNSVSAGTLVTPSTLNYGLDAPAAAIWTSPETIYVFNKDTVTQSYTAVVEGTSSGISLNVSPSSFSIPANDSLMITATLSVDNTVVLIEDENILRFTGSVFFKGTIDTVRVPWAFVRTNRLVVTTSEPNAFFFGYSNASFILSTDGRMVSWTSPTRAEVYSPVKGSYEFFTLFRNPAGTSKIVINEGISINNNDIDLFLDGALAMHPLIYHGVDHLGNSLNAYRAPQRTLITSLPDFGDFITTFQGGSDTLLLSTVSNSHSFKPVESQIDLVDTKTFHAIQFDKFTGMNGARTAVNSPVDFVQENFKVKVPPGTPAAVQLTQIWSYTDVNGTGGFSGIGADVDTVSVAGDEYAFTGYFDKSSIPSEDIAAKFYTSYADVPGLSLDYESPFIMLYKDSVVAAPRELVTPAIPRFESGATMTFGGAPAHLLVVWLNNIIGTNTLHFRPLFRGMLRENRYNDLVTGTYSLYDKNGVLLFTRSLNEPHGPLELTADTYTMVVTSSNYWLRNARGTITLTSEFNLGAGLSANPPSVTSFMVLDENRHTTDAVAKNDHATLRFSVNTVSGNVLPLFDSTKAWYRRHGTSPWTPLALTEIAELVENEGIIVQADLGAATAVDSIAVDLRIASKSANGFTLDQIVSPAFAVGNWDTVATGVPPTPDQGIPKRFALDQNYPNPFNPTTVIGYEIPGFSSVILKVYDVLGREVATLVNERKGAGKYSVTWNASSMSSGVYLYRLQAGAHSATKKLLLLK
jgi:subtilisin family serine protease